MIERLYTPENKEKPKKPKPKPKPPKQRSMTERWGLYLSKFSGCFSSKKNAKVITFLKRNEKRLVEDMDLELIIKRIKRMSSHVGIILGRLGIETDEYS